jgi:hypothetical protein
MLLLGLSTVLLLVVMVLLLLAQCKDMHASHNPWPAAVSVCLSALMHLMLLLLLLRARTLSDSDAVSVMGEGVTALLLLRTMFCAATAVAATRRYCDAVWWGS